MRARSARTGAAKRCTQSGSAPNASASASGESPARTRIWISRGVICGVPVVAARGFAGAAGGAPFAASVSSVAQRLVDGQLELLLPVGRLEDDVAGLGVALDEVQRAHGQTISRARRDSRGAHAVGGLP